MSSEANDRWMARTVRPVVVAVILAAIGCEEPVASRTVTPAADTAKKVSITEARLEPWPETIRVQGSLLAYEDSVVGSKLAGRVENVFVDLGSIVQAGQPLVTLVRNELDLRVQLAEAQLQQACAAIGITPQQDESQFEIQRAPGVMMEQALIGEAQSNVDRARTLVASRAVSEGEYDALVAQLKAAQARYNAALNLVGEQVSLIGVRRKELALARQMVVDSQIVAPFDGIVGERRVSPGEYVQVGQAVVTLVRADRLRFTAGVPESRAASVQVGQRVEIKLSGSEPVLPVVISRVSPTVMQSSRSILIQADVPNPKLDLQAGLFAEADVVVNPDAQAVVVPASAVSRFAGVQKVWLVENGVARQQTVRTGREDANRVEILEGLPAGSLLVESAADGHDGPVVARGSKPDVPLQAQSPDMIPTARESSDGAQ